MKFLFKNKKGSKDMYFILRKKILLNQQIKRKLWKSLVSLMMKWNSFIHFNLKLLQIEEHSGSNTE